MARARELRAASVAFPAMGTGVGGFPLDEAARVTVRAVREELAASPTIAFVIFAMRGAAAYQAFEAALAAPVGGSGGVAAAQSAPHSAEEGATAAGIQDGTTSEAMPA